MEQSRRKLDSLLNPSLRSESSGPHTWRQQDDTRGDNQDDHFSQLGQIDLVHEVLTRSGALLTDASRNSHNQLGNEGSAPFHISQYSQQEHHHHRSGRTDLPRREPQSALYQKWQSDRAQKVAQLPSARDQQTLRQAQHSMQLFQQTLASIQSVQR